LPFKLNSAVRRTEDRINEFEDRTIEFTLSEQLGEKTLKNEQSLRDP
jgi:hypothetical protein